ncbi:RNA metabolism protein [Lithospermum erythrorhizon]|uniref:RNA metabolism protein n=1 Tax=Lithospermum erythrorhizon TaxID=34254 RepID=A0AAV3NV03_LITER
MTIPMDSSSDQLSRERVQRLFNKNVELENKRKKAAQARIPSDPNIWQLMRENYEAIILEDHAFSEQHEIEYALWQLHYRKIEELRALFTAAVASAGSAVAQNTKGPPRGGPDRTTKIRAQFKAFLSEATGFYHDLMVKIRAKYGLQLGYFSDDPICQLSLSKDGVKLTELKKGLISCHRCFIYLGDLARYKGLYGEGESKARDFTAASSYYMQASSLWPSSGNPHHQLAIVASYSGDEVVTIYRYFRSLSVDSPFVTARDNLIIAFEKNRQSYSKLPGEVKTSAAMATSTRNSTKGRGKSEARMPPKDNMDNVSSIKETATEFFKAFGTRFVRLNGILFTRTSLETFGEVLSVVRNDLVELLSTGPDDVYNFGSGAAECRLVTVRLVAILIFTVHNVNRETENQSYAEILQRSALLQNAFAATFDIVSLLLDRCMQLSDPSASYLLPGIMVFVEWLACHQDIAVGSELDEKQASTRLYFWNKCIPFLNKLLACGSAFLDKDEDETCFFNMATYEEGETANRFALSEDFELRGFLPLVPAQLILDFSRKQSFGSDGGNKEKKVRIQRIIAAGKALANVVRVGEAGVYFDGKLKKFMIGSEPPAVDDYSLTNLLEVPELSNINQGNPALSELGIGSLQPKPQSVESEEEDEVILFKPSTTEKHVDDLALNMTQSDCLARGVDAVEVDLRKESGFSSAGLDAFYLQSVMNSNIKPPSSAPLNNVDYLQPIHSRTPKWLVGQAPLVNGLSNMNFKEQGLNMKYESQNYLGVGPSVDFSVPFPQSGISGTVDNYSIQIPETVVPSKLDSVMPSGTDGDSLSFNHSSLTSSGLKKNPVSRPLRHTGPPPGFGSFAPKVDDAMAVKNENSYVHPVDDYRWLDGYQFPTSNLSNGIDKSLHSSVHSYSSMSNGNSSIGMLNFPFPGKQMPTMQVQMENTNGWAEYQLSVQSKLKQEQQQQLQRQNHQSVAMQQQYKGQSLWEGRSLV